MSDQDSDERTEPDSEQDAGQDSGEDSGAEQEAAESDDADVSASGVVVEGYETHNAPREQTQALLEADSPDDVEDDLIKEIEEERDRRLDPENRPDNVEVDNTKRVFVPAEAKFEDSDIDQDPELGQEGLAPVGGEAGEGGATDSDAGDDSEGSDGSDGSEDADSSDHIEPDVESGDPKDETTTKTSGTSDPTDSEGEAATQSSGGKHKA